MGVTIAGKTPTSKRARATSTSMPEFGERGMHLSMVVNGEPTGVGRSSSRSVLGSTKGATPSSGQINPNKSPYWTTAHVREEVHPYQPTPPEADPPTGRRLIVLGGAITTSGESPGRNDPEPEESGDITLAGGRVTGNGNSARSCDK